MCEAKRFSPHTRANTGNAADPDHAYPVNLLESAFNLNPTQSGRPSFSQAPVPAACT